MIDIPAHDCDHTHAIVSALRGVRAVYRDPRPLTRRRGAHGWHFVLCTRSYRSYRRARHALVTWRNWRVNHPWLLRWERLAPWQRQWANSTSWCESRDNPRALSAGGKYRGLMQFDFSTWHLAGGSGDPIDATANEQRVRAVYWMGQHGTSPWPNCG